MLFQPHILFCRVSPESFLCPLTPILLYWLKPLIWHIPERRTKRKTFAWQCSLMKIHEFEVATILDIQIHSTLRESRSIMNPFETNWNDQWPFFFRRPCLISTDMHRWWTNTTRRRNSSNLTVRINKWHSNNINLTVSWIIRESKTLRAYEEIAECWISRTDHRWPQ